MGALSLGIYLASIVGAVIFTGLVAILVYGAVQKIRGR